MSDINKLELKPVISDINTPMLESITKERFHSSLNYETPDSVYFGTNKTKIPEICKFDRDSLVKSLLWVFVYNKQISQNTCIKEAS